VKPTALCTNRAFRTLPIAGACLRPGSCKEEKDANSDSARFVVDGDDSCPGRDLCRVSLRRGIAPKLLQLQWAGLFWPAGILPGAGVLRVSSDGLRQRLGGILPAEGLLAGVLGQGGDAASAAPQRLLGDDDAGRRRLSVPRFRRGIGEVVAAGGSLRPSRGESLETAGAGARTPAGAVEPSDFFPLDAAVNSSFLLHSAQEASSILPIHFQETSREGGTNLVPFQDKEHGKNGLLAMFFFCAERRSPKRQTVILTGTIDR
jgi:hypothetical protein